MTAHMLVMWPSIGGYTNFKWFHLKKNLCARVWLKGSVFGRPFFCWGGKWLLIEVNLDNWIDSVNLRLPARYCFRFGHPSTFCPRSSSNSLGSNRHCTGRCYLSLTHQWWCGSWLYLDPCLWRRRWLQVNLLFPSQISHAWSVRKRHLWGRGNHIRYFLSEGSKEWDKIAIPGTLLWSSPRGVKSEEWLYNQSQMIS